MRIVLTTILILFSYISNAQTVSVIHQNTYKNSLRGLSVVNDKVLWASGSKGVVGKSIDGGLHWDWQQVKGFEKNDFRDIEAFDENTAVIMSIASPAYILRTTDGGVSWNKVFEDTTADMFLDAMHFANDSIGVVVGDPIHNKAFVYATANGGKSWTALENITPIKAPELQKGEAFFASSGGNVKVIYNSVYQRFDVVMVTGGLQSRLFLDGVPVNLPISNLNETSGANAIDITPDFDAIVVGGDFKNDSINNGNCFLIDFKKGASISLPQTPPKGYKSSVVFINKKLVAACGTSGVDISKDAGKNFSHISSTSLNTVAKAKYGNAIFFVGKDGTIAKLIIK